MPLLPAMAAYLAADGWTFEVAEDEPALRGVFDADGGRRSSSRS